MGYIRCYYEPVNIVQLGSEILVPEEQVYDYTKELYEKGLGRRTIPTQREEELQSFFLWRVKYKSTNIIFRKIIDILMNI